MMSDNQITHLVKRTNDQNGLVKLTCPCGWSTLSGEQFVLAVESRHLRLNPVQKGKQ